MNNQNMNFADIKSNDLESINSLQSQIKTKSGKEVVLLAYEK